MAYNENSDVLRQHRDKLLEIALRHAREGGLKSVNRDKIAKEGGISLGTVSNALGRREEMLNRVLAVARDRGIELSY